MAGSVYTFLSKGSASGNDGAITTSQGRVVLGQSGLFLPSEYQAVVGAGLQLVAGPAQSPASLLTAPTLAAGASGLPNGTYRGAVTFVTAAGETRIGPEVTITVVNDQISWTNIPTAPAASGVTARKLYRTVAGGSAGTEKLVTTLSDDSTTTYTDNVADGSLGATCPASDTSAVVGATSNINPQPDFALLTGNPTDDQYAVGAGTGAKIGTAGGILAYQTGTAYTSGTQVLHSGQIFYAQTNFTSGASFAADGSNWAQTSPLGVSVSSNPTGAGLIPVSTGTTSQIGSWLGTSALATNATAGFAPIPTMAGIPSGAPSAVGAASPLGFNSTTGELIVYNPTTSAWSGIGATYSALLIPSGDTTGVTDQARWNAAYAACPTGGKIMWRVGSPYYYNASLTVSKGLSLEGESLTFPDTLAGTSTAASQVSGVILMQVTAATDVIKIPINAGQGVNIKNVCLTFGASIANTNTGHGINAIPSLNGAGPTHQLGMGYATWENIAVIGHDGNHYATTCTNHVLLSANRIAWGDGGGMQFVADNTSSNTGNATISHTWGYTRNAGSADLYNLSSSTGPGSSTGALSLMTFIRPGGAVLGAALTNGQHNWNDRAGAADPNLIRLFGNDTEGAAPVVLGIDTQVIGGTGTGFTGNSLGYGYLTLGGTVGQFNTGFGIRVLSSQPSGTQNSAGGYQSQQSLLTGSNNTSWGSGSLNANTAGSGNAAFGISALAANLASNNHAFGTSAGASNVNGVGLTVGGYTSFTNSNGTGTVGNTGWGYATGHTVTTAAQLTYTGYQAGFTNSTGNASTATGYNSLLVSTAGNNTATGAFSGTALTSGANNVFDGVQAAAGATTAANSVASGYQAAFSPGGAGNSANASIAGVDWVAVGAFTGVNSTGDYSSWIAMGYEATITGTGAIAIGRQTNAGAAGAVAIGYDSGGTGASTTTANIIALGTALHQVQLKNNTTGAGSAALGANSPAVTNTAPYTWFKLMSSDGSTVYVPAWK